MLTLMKFLIIACVVGMLRTSGRFQAMSRELDESALSALKRAMSAAEESGFHPETIPLLMLLTALAFIYAAITAGAGR